MTFTNAFGFGIHKVKRIVFGVNTNHLDRFVGVLHLNSVVKAETILKEKARDPKQTLIEERVGSFSLYAPAKGSDGFCLVNDNTLLLGGGKELKEVLARTRPANLSAGLREALKRADPGATVTVAVDVSALSADKPALPGVDLKKVIANCRAAALTIKISGQDITLYGVAVCKDAKSAAEVRKQAEAFRDSLGKQVSTAGAKKMPKEVVELSGKVKFATKGHLVATTLTVKDNTALALIKAFWLPDLDLNPQPPDKGQPPLDEGPPPNLPDPSPKDPQPPAQDVEPPKKNAALPPPPPKPPVAEKKTGQRRRQGTRGIPNSRWLSGTHGTGTGSKSARCLSPFGSCL
jgi:hypothetical protein